MLATRSISMLGVLLILVSGCGAPSSTTIAAPKSIALMATDMAYSRNELSASVGQTVLLHFGNDGALPHDLTIDRIAVNQPPQTSTHDHSAEEPPADLHLHLQPGEKNTFSFTPTAAGSYTFYCSVLGHREAGMEGTLVVEGPSS